MAASDIITWILGIAGLAYIAYRIGRGPFVILGRRLTGSLPLRPPGTEPGAERWFAAAGVTMFVGLGIAAVFRREVGYPITALGALLLSFTGVLIVQDHRGAARAFARRAWTEFGMEFPGQLLLTRIIGGAMIPMGIFGAVVVMAQVFG
jgi:hypothetical protein